jgi:hypothetical protein
MNTITLPNDGAPDLRFAGELVAQVSSAPQNGRWTTLALYKTQGGQLVTHAIGHTEHRGETPRFKAVPCKTEADVILSLGQGRLAKALYASAKIENIREIE